jgi:hypothetical protein
MMPFNGKHSQWHCMTCLSSVHTGRAVAGSDPRIERGCMYVAACMQLASGALQRSTTCVSMDTTVMALRHTHLQLLLRSASHLARVTCVAKNG